ncbi:MAG: hypothetical protein KJO61_12020 [Deltaproteobacteria bacterium]|nr:hypothetical protein [Deltaproteobacteria bacterium]
MQTLFPEGACFTVTLYGLAWANAFPHVNGKVRLKALKEMQYALKQQHGEASIYPFSDTEVRNGVFWLGQRNLLLGRYLACINPVKRNTALVQEFHFNSAALSEAFLASPTHHLNSYPGLCWPADNVTALVSLKLHDALYGTEYGEAYDAWKNWTLSHSDPKSGMPAGHLDNESGQHYESARGCANSWMIALLSEIDPVFAGHLYHNYKRNFGIRRLGIRMFREWPQGHEGHGADIDSGPIIWGAGVTATGVGLATARSQGDLATEADIRDLLKVFGFPQNISIEEQTTTRYLFDLVPVGDAFLTWGYSVVRPSSNSSRVPSRMQRIMERWQWFSVIIVCFIFTIAQGVYFGYVGWRRYRIAHRSMGKGHDRDKSPEQRHAG